MKTHFIKEEIMANRGCYEPSEVEALSFINNPSISLVEILNSEISIKDKQWFLFNKSEMTLDQKKDLCFILAKIVSEIFNKKYPTDNRVNECLKAIQDFRGGKINIDELLEKRRAAAAAYAADAAAYAAYAAAYAAYAAYADAAADAAAAAADAAAYDDDYKSYSKHLQKAMIAFVENQLVTA